FLLEEATVTNTEDAYKLQKLAQAAEPIVKQIAWMADKGTSVADGSGVPNVRGEAEDWLLSPAYHKAQGSIGSSADPTDESSNPDACLPGILVAAQSDNPEAVELAIHGLQGRLSRLNRLQQK